MPEGSICDPHAVPQQQRQQQTGLYHKHAGYSVETTNKQSSLHVTSYHVATKEGSVSTNDRVTDTDSQLADLLPTHVGSIKHWSQKKRWYALAALKVHIHCSKMSTPAPAKQRGKLDNKTEAEASAYGPIKAAVVKDCNAALERGLTLLEWYQEYISKMEPAPMQALKALVACAQCGQVTTDKICGPCNERIQRKEWGLIEDYLEERGGWERHFPAAAAVQQQEAPTSPLSETAIAADAAAATALQQEEPSIPSPAPPTDGSIMADPLPVATVPQEPPTSPLVSTAIDGSLVHGLTTQLREVTGWWEEEKCRRAVAEEAASNLQLQLEAAEQELAAMRVRMLQLETQATAMHVTPGGASTPHLLHTTLPAVADYTTDPAVPAAADGDEAAGASDAEGLNHDTLPSSSDAGEEAPSSQQQQEEGESHVDDGLRQQQQEQHQEELEEGEPSRGGQAPPVARWDSASEAHARHAAGLAAAADAKAEISEQQVEQPQAAAATAPTAPAARLGASIVTTAMGVAGCTALVAVAAAACGQLWPTLASG
eukprot:jgi/Chrzof1/6941/Cz02g04120.t1